MREIKKITGYNKAKKTKKFKRTCVEEANGSTVQGKSEAGQIE